MNQTTMTDQTAAVSDTSDASDSSARPSNFGLHRLASLALLALLLLPAAAQTSTNSRPVRPDFSSFKLITDRNIFSPTRTALRPMRYDTPTTTRTTARQGDYFALVGTMEYEKGAFAFFDGTSSEYRKTLKPRDTIAGYRLGEITQSHVSLTQDTNTLQLKVGMQMRHNSAGGWTAVTPTETSVGSSSYGSTTTRSDSSMSDRRSRDRGTSDRSTPAGRSGSPGGDGRSGRSGGEVIPTPPGGEGPAVIVIPGEGTTLMAPAEGSPDTAPAPAAAAPSGGADEVLRRLMQRREQELNR